jgi:signal transduction histidine kinase
MNSSLEKGQSIRLQLILAALFPLVLFGLMAIWLSASALQELSRNLVLQPNTAPVQEPWEAIVGPVVYYQWGVGVLLALGAVLSLTMLSLSISRVMRPLTTLAREVQHIAPGHVFHPLKVEGPLELRALISAFNQMVIRLAEQQSALRQYAVQVLQSQEEERQRLARDLHDGTVQDLVGLTQRIELCRNALEHDPEATSRRLDELQSLARLTLDDVRRMSNDLRPHILENLGLPAALQALCDGLTQQMPCAQVRCEIAGRQRRLSPELELAVFRIVQEALTNVRKHASNASQVNVTLSFDEAGIFVVTQDNGPGFSAPDAQALVRTGHLGLAGMVERARLFGGALDVMSAPGQGTTITLRLAC